MNLKMATYLSVVVLVCVRLAYILGQVSISILFVLSSAFVRAQRVIVQEGAAVFVPVV